MRLIAAPIIVALTLSVTVNAQGKVDAPKLPGTYWLKYSLIFLPGCRPVVTPDNIVFTEGGCPRDPYSGKILPRGTEVRLTSIDRGKNFAKVSLSDAAGTYEIAVADRSEKTFRRAFGLLFTERGLEEFYETNCPDDVKTKRQMIQCIGFPIYVTRDGDVEYYFYIIEFAGYNSIGGSFDGFTVKIKKNRIIDVSGYV